MKLGLTLALLATPLAAAAGAHSHTKTKAVLEAEKKWLSPEYKDTKEGKFALQLHQIVDESENKHSKPSLSQRLQGSLRGLYTTTTEYGSDKAICKEIYDDCTADDDGTTAFWEALGYTFPTVNVCARCGFGDMWTGKSDCYDCADGQQIAVAFDDCTGFCVATADAAEMATFGYLSMADSDCQTYGTSYPLSCEFDDDDDGASPGIIVVAIVVPIVVIALCVGIYCYMKKQNGEFTRGPQEGK
jgi:hypothetical protein